MPLGSKPFILGSYAEGDTGITPSASNESSNELNGTEQT